MHRIALNKRALARLQASQILIMHPLPLLTSLGEEIPGLYAVEVEKRYVHRLDHIRKHSETFSDTIMKDPILRRA